MSNGADKLNGHFSQRLLNEELYSLHKIIENINYDEPSEPDTSTNGALWRDGDNLKYSDGNKWNPLFKSKFAIIDDISSPTQPINPVYNQLWIDNGVLKYYNGSSFVVLKADTADTQTNAFDYYNYLLIHCLKQFGENYASGTSAASYFSKTINSQEWQKTSSDSVYSYTILQTEYQMQSDIGYLLTTDISSGSNTVYKQPLDDTEYQIFIDVQGNITIYVNELRNVTISLVGRESISGVSGAKINTYLVPNANNDRIFFDGIETDKHTRYNDVTMMIDPKDIGSANVSLAHVDGKYLSDIKQNIILVSRTSPYVNIKEEYQNTNTEYYIYNANTKQMQLMIKYEIAPDYIVIPNGIMLTKSALNKYLTTDMDQTFVIAVTFSFKSFKTKGALKYYTNIIENVEDGIFIPDTTITTNNSFLLVDNQYIESFTVKNNKLFIPNYSGKHKIILVKCGKRHIFAAITHNEDGIITISKHILDQFTTPILCVNNYYYTKEDLTLNTALQLYTFDMNYLDAQYLQIVEAKDLFVKSGVVDESNTIVCSYTEIPLDNDYLLMMNHKLCDNNTIVRSKTSGSLYSKHINEGKHYLLFKSTESEFAINTTISSSKIYLDKFDNVLTYIDGILTCNTQQVNLTYPEYQDQVILNEQNGFNLYNPADKTSTAITDQKIIDALSSVLYNTYSIDNQIISFDNKNNKYTGKRYAIYAYSYGNSVEKKIITGEINDPDNTDGIYYLNGSDQYTLGTNELSIYINGIRQYPDTYTELSPISFKLDTITDSVITYVIEPLENQETISYEYCVIDKTNRIQGYKNTYSTDSILSNGFIKVFKNGVRLNNTEYSIKNSFTIQFDEATDDDVFLIESRNDYSIREASLPVEFDTIKWLAYNNYNGYEIPDDLILSRDSILIYLNGLLIGDNSCYILDRVNNTIALDTQARTLLDLNTKDNGFITFEWR